MCNRFIAGAIFFALVFSATTVTAQGTGPNPDAANTQSSQQSTDGASPVPEGDDYWSEARGVYVVQKRPFLKQGKFATTLYTGLIPNNIFENYYPIGLRLNYFILENIGLELAGSYSFRGDSGLSQTLEDQSGVAAGTGSGSGNDIRLGDRQRFHSSFSVMWSPFYGKGAAHNAFVSYFDVFVVGGVGLTVVENKDGPGAPVETATQPKGVLGGGFAFYFAENMAAKADFRQFVFQKTGETQSGLAKASEISLGVSYFF